jgi:hypothetical protein
LLGEGTIAKKRKNNTEKINLFVKLHIKGTIMEGATLIASLLVEEKTSTTSLLVKEKTLVTTLPMEGITTK